MIKTLVCRLNGIIWMGILFFITQVNAQINTTIPNIDSLSEQALAELATNTFIAAEGLENEANERLKLAYTANQEASDQYEMAKADTTMTQPMLDSLKLVAKESQKQHKKAKKQYDFASSTVAFTKKVANMEFSEQQKNIKKALKKTADLGAELYGKNDVVAEPEPEKKSKKILFSREKDKKTDPITATPTQTDTLAPAVESIKVKEPKKTKPLYKNYDPKEDVMLNPPSPPCVLALVSKDMFSGEMTHETAPEELFRFTNPSLRKVYVDKSHVVAHSSLGRTGSVYYLKLTFTVNDPNARKAFGSLPKSSIMTLLFTDGKTYQLQASRADEGTVSPDGESTAYTGQYILDNTAIKMLKDVELDRIRVAWANGFDDYDVQFVNLIIHQINCLNKN